MTEAPPPQPADMPHDFWKGVFAALGLATGIPIVAGMLIGLASGLLGGRWSGPVGDAVQLFAGIAGIMALGIGVSQLLWIVPLFKRYRDEGRTSLAQGLRTGAWIVFLLNASCWGVVGLIAK